MNSDTHNKLITRLKNKIRLNSKDIVRTEEYYLEDADIIVISYGCTARSAYRAVRESRAAGIHVGMIRLISIWPFPDDLFRELGEKAYEFIVAELNLGQIRREVERLVQRPVIGVHHAGGEMIPPQPILDAIKQASI